MSLFSVTKTEMVYFLIVNARLRRAHDEDDDPDDDEEAWSPFGTAPPGAPPAYRAGEANAMAAEQSDDDPPTKPVVRQSRYLDDEAAESR